MCCWQIITFSNDPAGSLATSLLKSSNKTVLANFVVLSIFGQFDYELETHLLKSENHFHAQHLLPRAVDKLTDDHIATIFEAYQADIYFISFQTSQYTKWHFSSSAGYWHS
jgi:hypothetical protein